MYSPEDQLISELFKALGHPLRVRILKLLLEGSRCVCEILPEVPAEQSNTSQHLNVMKNAGILTRYKDGSKVIYQIRNDRLKTLIALASEITQER